MADDVRTAATAASRVGDLANAIRDRIPSTEDGLSRALGVAESVDQRLDAIEHRLAVLDTMPDDLDGLRVAFLGSNEELEKLRKTMAPMVTELAGVRQNIAPLRDDVAEMREVVQPLEGVSERVGRVPGKSRRD